MDNTTAEPAGVRAAGRVISSRRALPSGRALVGALLITVATIGAFAVATSTEDGPATDYLVMTRDLRAGDSITEADVRFEPMTLSEELAGRTLNSTAGLEGATI